MRVLIVGCGYVGLPLGLELVRQGHDVFGLRRSVAADGALKSAGIKPLHADIADASSLSALPNEFDWVVNCAAAGGGSTQDYRDVYFTGTCNLTGWLDTARLKKYVYTGSTSVYAQNDASLVDENSPTLPEVETGKVLVATEQVLGSAAREKKFPAVILRSSAIYGSGRSHWLRQFLSGEARIEGNGDRFLNMIHRDDLIGAIVVALKRASAGSVFNATDNEPVAQVKWFEWISGRLGKPMPPFVPENAQATRRRGVTNKRVSNARLRRELGYEFKFPTFREGFEAELRVLGLPGNFC